MYRHSYRHSSRYERPVDPYWMLEDYEQQSRAVELCGKPREYTPDDVFVTKVENILSAPPCMGVPPDPTNFIRKVYLGLQSDGENIERLKRLKITHVLNVDGFPLGCKQSRINRYKGTGIIYEELPIDDTPTFEIWTYFSPAHRFLDLASVSGRVLIMDSGVSRGGVIALSYMMHCGRRLLEAVRDLKSRRRVVCCNRNFLKQLVNYARLKGMLDPEPQEFYTPTYGRRIDRYRINGLHLPTFIRDQDY